MRVVAWLEILDVMTARSISLCCKVLSYWFVIYDGVSAAFLYSF